MAFRNLRQYLDELEKRGDLKRIGLEVDWNLEMTEIIDRTVKSGGPALLFEKVKGYDIAVAANLFGTWERMKLVLGADPDDLAKEVAGFLKPEIPETLWEKVKVLPRLAQLASFIPKVVRTGPCKEIVRIGDQANLLDLPIPKCWPDDGGRYICLGLVFTQNPDDGTRNMGLYRQQVFDQKTLGFHAQTHKDGHRHFLMWEKKGKDMPCAIALGGDPVLVYAATAPLPEEVDELLLAGFLRKRPVELVPCQTIPLEVPAEAEIVIEGFVKAGVRRLEGPFGDHMGVYSLQEEYPVFEVSAITMRKDPIYPHTIVGKPLQEDYWLGKATERIFLPLIRLILPEVVDICFPPEGLFHNWAIVSIRKRYPGHARKVLHGLWGMGQMMFTKCIVVVDDDCDLTDMSDILWRTFNFIDPGRDIVITEGPMDDLHFATPLWRYGTKMGIDATRKWKEEGFTRPWPPDIVMSEDVKKKVDALWSLLGIDNGRSNVSQRKGAGLP
ncbi:MAG: menaquinone biosynthesis decarboxylase [Armatimonadetes bacterium]|nr:menaquinone biosynthesis decarboxylase [Armatimonadota bacterium]MDW8121543.1 menaquinone biosynthesis decarboxylase [Armatimonadota bacterium]